MPSDEFYQTLLKENEQITNNFREVHKKILKILKFKDFFSTLLSAIEDQFKIPYVWISIIEDSAVPNLLKSLEEADLLQNRVNMIDRKIFNNLTLDYHKPVLVNDDICRYYDILSEDISRLINKPENMNSIIKSIAVSPISLDGEIIGSLNQADPSEGRYEPSLDTSDLEHLAIVVSQCLSNVTAHEKLEFLAFHDPLTGLLNRRVMEKTLEREFERADRYSNVLSVVFLDLDYFKQINDTYGHERGDDVLKYVADTLMEMCRQSDVVARYAGDEFVVILPETNPNETGNLMQRIKEFLGDNPLKVDDYSIKVSMSYGVASTYGQFDSHHTLLKEADKKLYDVKNARPPRADGVL